MKKIFTTFFIALGIYASTNAQSRKPFEFGVSTGINAAYVTPNAEYSTSTGLLWSPNFAVSAERALNDDWGFKVKVIYDIKGWGNSYYVDGTKTVTGVNYNINYITVPITPTIHFGESIKWYASAGPYVGFLLSSKDDYTNNDLKSNFNSTDFGISGGLGIEFPVATKFKIFFEFEGQLGFSNILVYDSKGAENFRSAFNLGVKF